MRVSSSISSKISLSVRASAELSPAFELTKLATVSSNLGHHIVNTLSKTGASSLASPAALLIVAMGLWNSSFAKLVVWKLVRGPFRSVGSKLKSTVHTFDFSKLFDSAPALQV